MENYRCGLNGISDAGYAHVKKVWEVFEIKKWGEYHNLYVQSDIFLLADVLESFRNMCLKEYGLDPAHFLTAAGLAWDVCLKKAKIVLELLTDINMLLMTENGIRGGICQATRKYAKSNNNYLKNYDKNIESSYLEFLDASNLYEWGMSQKFPVNAFKWVEKNYQNLMKIL